LCPTNIGLKLLAKFVFKVSAFCLDTRADGCATVWLPYQ